MFNSKNNKIMNELIIKSKSEQTQAEYLTEKYNVNVTIQSANGGKVESVYETFLDPKDNGYIANVNIRVEAGTLRYNLDVAKSDETEAVVSVAREIERLVFKTETTTLEETSEEKAVAE